MPTQPQTSSFSWLTEGNRKWSVTVLSIICGTIVAVALIAIQPEGLDLQTALTADGGLIGLILMLFKGANMYEHALKAPAPTNKPPTPPASSTMLAMPFLLLLLAFSLGLGGCASSPQPLPLLTASLAGAEIAAGGAQQQAVEADSIPGCYSASALQAAFGASAQAVGGWQEGLLILPEVRVDLRACNGLQGGALSEREWAAAAVGWRDALAPPIVALASRLIDDTEDVSCETREIAQAVLLYVSQASGEVLELLSSGSGVLVVEPVVVDVSVCEA